MHDYCFDAGFLFLRYSYGEKAIYHGGPIYPVLSKYTIIRKKIIGDPQGRVKNIAN